MNAIKSSNILKLLIVGKAPYTLNATGIAFIHKTWPDMENPSCSGLYVLQSLVGKNIHSIIAEQSAVKNTPEDFAHLLLSYCGVALINASYTDGKPASMKPAWLAVNSAITQHAVQCGAHIILCGSAKHLKDDVKVLTNSYDAVCHPDVRNTNTPKKYADWVKWWRLGRLKMRYSLPDIPLSK